MRGAMAFDWAERVGRRMVCALLMAFAGGLAAWPVAARAADEVSFSKQIHPIFQRRCINCHGALKQKNDLRLDAVQLVRKGGSGGPGVVAGNVDGSLLVEAIEGRNGVPLMPPEGGALKPDEIALIKQWIAAGAPGADEPIPEDPNKHWSFQPVRRPELPQVDSPEWGAHAIDAFVRARQQTAGVTAVGLAPKEVLLRRVTLDLLGLPPTRAELDAFLADDSPAAYERVVDQLLARPEYAQRWARHWMDVWRYSDWDGYADEVRESQPNIWRWRDWIVDSLAADKPYDQMVREMLAADELAPTDPDALRATGFLVRHWFKFNRNVWLDNAVEHTGKAFLGLTFNCSKCHDHFYDPITQPEYFQLRAFFEPYDIRTDPWQGERDPKLAGLVRSYDKTLDAKTVLFTRGDEARPENDKPLAAVAPKLLSALATTPVDTPLPPAAYYPGLDSVFYERLLADAQAQVATADEAVTKARAEWIAAGQAAVALATNSPEPQVPSVELTEAFDQLDAARWTAVSGVWQAANGRLSQSQGEAEPALIALNQDTPTDFELSVRVKIDGGPMWQSAGVAFDDDGAGNTGARLFLSVSGGKVQLYLRENGKDVYPMGPMQARSVALGTDYRLTVLVRDQLVNVWVDDQLAIAFTLPSPRPEGRRVGLFTYSAIASFDELRLKSLPTDAVLTDSVQKPPAAVPSQTPAEREALVRKRVAKASAAVERAELVAAQTRHTHAALPVARAADLARFTEPPAANATELARLVLVAQRTTAAAAARVAVHDARELLRDAREKLLVEGQAVDALKAAKAKVDELVGQLATKETALVAAVELIGNSDGKTDYETFTPVYPAKSTGRRAALAAMITAKDNPLFARVAVNHLWMRHFGDPLVASVFDLGANGQKPTHPELLDWLAAEFAESGFKMKPLHRLIVTSRTYRLHSAPADNPALKSDPDNHLYWRFRPRRAEAEVVRDSILATSGMLDVTPGGPDLDPEKGVALTRRTMYFRGSKEKRMTFTSLFDGPNVSECYRRAESIVPQQALAMANSPLSRAQARLLAAKLTAEVLARLPGDATDAATNRAREQAFVNELFRATLSRAPSAGEVDECVAFLVAQATVAADPTKLTGFSGAQATADSQPAGDATLRARESLCHVLLNHHEFVTMR